MLWSVCIVKALPSFSSTSNTASFTAFLTSMNKVASKGSHQDPISMHRQLNKVSYGVRNPGRVVTPFAFNCSRCFDTSAWYFSGEEEASPDQHKDKDNDKDKDKNDLNWKILVNCLCSQGRG